MRRFVKATAEFYPDFVRLFGELGLDDPILPLERWIEEWAPNIWFLLEDEFVSGYTMFLSKSEPAHLTNLAVHSDLRRRGLGRALMLHAAEQLRHAGRKTWYLNVRIDNVPAIRLYESLGFVPTSRMVVFRVDTAAMERLPKSDSSIQIREVESIDDNLIETKFGLPDGRIAESRKNTTGINLGLYDMSSPERIPVGYGRFAPNFPGVYPLRLAEPTCVRALIEYVFPLKNSSRSYIQLVVENDPPLIQALQDAGATIYLDANHMEATLSENEVEKKAPDIIA